MYRLILCRTEQYLKFLCIAFIADMGVDYRVVPRFFL